MTEPTFTPDVSKLERARKLLAMAEGGDTPEECEAFSKKAMLYMAQHGIEQAQLAARKTGVPDDVVHSRVVHIVGTYSPVRAGMLSGIAHAMRCRLIDARNSEKWNGYVLTGFDTDRARVMHLFESLTRQVDHLLPNVNPPMFSRQSVQAYRRSWLLGFQARVTERVTEAELLAAGDEDQDDAMSTALVLRDRNAAVQRAFKQEFPRTRQTAVRSSGNGYEAGQAAGSRAGLSTGGGIGGGRRALSR